MPNYNPANGNPAYCEYTDELYSYDNMGRANRIGTAFPSEVGWAAHETDIAYDLMGNMTSLRYPDGRVVDQTFNSAGQLLNSTFDNWNGQHVGYNYASGLTYTPAGAQAEVTLGGVVYIHTPYNNRGQMCQVWSNGTQTLIDTHIYYGGSTIYCGNTPGNNGNITEIKDWRTPDRTRYFGYDNLNRLTSYATGATSPGTVQQSYTFDSFGNLKQSGTLNSLPDYDTLANNRINGDGYDNAGNIIQINDGISNPSYSYDAESKMFKNSAGGYYTYDAADERMRKDVNDGTYTEYQYLNGQPIAEKHSDGTWSDYIYANGQKIARADSYNRYIQFTGSFSSTGNYGELNLTPVSSQFDGQYVILSGDHLVWKQRQSQAYGGVYLFASGLNAAWTLKDQNNEYCNDSMQTDGAWHSRSVDLSDFAGKTVSSINLVAEGNSPAGNWTMQYADIAVVSASGAVIPIYDGATTVAGSPWGTSGYTFGGINVQSVPSATGDTAYFVGDQVSSTRLTVADVGWPISEDMYYPFGQEPDATSDPNHYKFTGKERDAESGLDYFGARYYASSMGRFMTPDPSGLAYADPTNPQSLNLYSYAINNPLKYIDPTGMGYCFFGGPGKTPVNDSDPGDYYMDPNSPGDCTNLGGVYEADADTTINVNSNGDTSCTGNCEDPLEGLLALETSQYYIKLKQLAPANISASAQQFIGKVAQDTAGFPDVCSGGGFVYAGVQAPVGKAHGFAGYLGNYDSKGGFTNGGLVEGSGHSAGAAGAYSPKGGPEALVFVPFAEAGGGLVGVSKEGLAVGGYVGTPEKFPVGVGAGAYFNISTMGACNHR